MKYINYKYTYKNNALHIIKDVLSWKDAIVELLIGDSRVSFGLFIAVRITRFLHVLCQDFLQALRCQNFDLKSVCKLG